MVCPEPRPFLPDQGFLPLISQYVVARTGDPYAGLWYTWAVVLMALLVSLWGLKWKGDKLAE